jgi:hypothetical protein
MSCPLLTSAGGATGDSAMSAVNLDCASSSAYVRVNASIVHEVHWILMRELYFGIAGLYPSLPALDRELWHAHDGSPGPKRWVKDISTGGRKRVAVMLPAI